MFNTRQNYLPSLSLKSIDIIYRYKIYLSNLYIKTVSIGKYIPPGALEI